MSDGFSFLVLGRPVGKARPRFGRGRAFTPRETELAEQGIRAAWENAGAVRLDGPIAVQVLMGLVRPRDHYTSKGALSAKGLRFPYPHRQKPDVDNALKLVLDSLNTRAWPDDVQIIQAQVDRLWDNREYTRVVARTVELPATAEAA